RVALIERARTGGDCLWTGCVPSKTLIAAATLAHGMRHADQVGLTPVAPQVDCAAVMEHAWRVIHRIDPEDSPQRLRAAGVEVIEAEGRFTDPEVARVGLTEADARNRWGERVQITQLDYAKLDRAITAGRAYGFAKLIGDRRGRLAARYTTRRVRAVARVALAALRAIER
ncbi:MAG: hypothetical protein ACRDLV_15900, partial [Solirubrobacteraceae bacterium]